ncbi:2-C-methyl-D-erythritol 4-phosphate cytidylyltransferase [Anaerotruncus rubiinfantis]|jgi:2-C-methyl-D-erythritol 4-phosphate cytidylyltransferase|uniref:2-C-methyl-D-erythritol 4-phosphate cytidylyltransferase n=1 Tax=Anaerotruncus rubiinfantis TaxID=1720200 RepID=UPI001896B9E7|nr:2-C-methyl-D-erythritol 4-phosphate cytidylyltransferase [Anaerotruncus rubiinfantis]
MFWKKELEKPYVACIVPAAGNSTRMNGIDKQFEEIEGMPVIVRTLQALSWSDWIDEIVIVARQADIPDMLALIRAYAIPKVRSVVTGGDTRRKSVECGLAAVSEQTQYIAVHDGARPLVPQQVIADAVMDAFRCGAAAAAVPVVDTIKVADADRKIVDTPDRRRLYAVQTPQVFEIARYRQAVREAKGDFTDDCQMLESIGQPVYLTKGDYINLKITTPVDLLTAQAIVLAQEGERL